MVKTQKRKYKKQKKGKMSRRKLNKRKTKHKKLNKRKTRRRKMKGGSMQCLNCLKEVRELIRVSKDIKSEILRYYGEKDRGVDILKVIKNIDCLVNRKLYPLLLVLEDSEKCRECFEKEPKFNLNEFNELLGLILNILEKGEIYNEKKEKYVKLSENTQGLVYLMRQTMILLNATESHIRKKINVKDELRKRIESRKKLLSSPLVRPRTPLSDEILKSEGSINSIINTNPKIKKILDEETKKMENSISPITVTPEVSNTSVPSTPEGMFKPINSDSD